MKRFAVAGHPVAHSRSPALHNAWFEALGIEARYGILDLDPAQLPSGSELLDQLSDLGLSGVNLTVPLKQLCLGAVDHLDPDALAAGALNTLVWRDGWIGHNTDVEGFRRAAVEAGSTTGKAVVIGAGGASRAVVLALRGSHDVVVMNRTATRAEVLANQLGVTSRSWGATALEGADLVVMAVSGPGNAAVAALELPTLAPGAIWIDLNYWNPAPPHRAELLHREVSFDDGSGMLLHQAALAFELFTGHPPPLALGRGLLFPSAPCDKSNAGG